jgi:alpha-galactosidase
MHKLVLSAAVACGLLLPWAACADTPGPASSPTAISMAPPPATPEVHAPFIVGIHPKTPFLWTIPVTGVRPLKFSAHGLPHGLSLNASTGAIIGSIAKAGDYAVQVRVKNSAGMDSHLIHIVAGPTLALTPPMGWNSYDAFGDDVTQSEVLANARYLKTNLQPYGWDTVVVDFRWYDPGTASNPNHPWQRAGVPLTMDAYGRVTPSPDKFPSATDGRGFTALAARIHAMGLSFGIHIMRGIPRNAVKANLPILGTEFHASDAADTSDTCPWCPDMYGVRGDTPAGQSYYDSLFRLYASWGVDFVKMDDTSRPYHTDEIEAVDHAITHCGRSIELSLSPGGTPLDDATHVEAHANMWRESGDFWDHWEALEHEFTLGASWRDYGGQGHWPDADMLPLGHLSISNRSVGLDRQTNFTHDEQITLLTLWSLLPSPLMVGANLPDNDPWTLALLTNPDVLAVDQDSSGATAMPVNTTGDTEVWAKTLADGTLAVGLFNRGDAAGPVTAYWSDLHITGPYLARDLWRRQDLGSFHDGFSTTVPAHGAVLLRLRRANH